MKSEWIRSHTQLKAMKDLRMFQFKRDLRNCSWQITQETRAEEVGTGHMSTKNADVAPLTYDGSFLSSGPFQQTWDSEI